MKATELAEERTKEQIEALAIRVAVETRNPDYSKYVQTVLLAAASTTSGSVQEAKERTADFKLLNRQGTGKLNESNRDSNYKKSPLNSTN